MSDMRHDGMSIAIEMCMGAFTAVGAAVAARSLRSGGARRPATSLTALRLAPRRQRGGRLRFGRRTRQGRRPRAQGARAGHHRRQEGESEEMRASGLVPEDMGVGFHGGPGALRPL